ncbi:PQQ-like beta-propeller repeat protein [Candidatus Poribacteria bacterium]|nr:PQQ-like beta-propeller repeat protein [Candidatus Poribacteria bacterium]
MLIKNIFRPVIQNATLVLLGVVLMGLSSVLARGDDLLTYYYAQLPQTSWPTIHRDSCNSNYVPFAGPDSLEIKWTALDGARLLTAATVGPEGYVYHTTGTGGDMRYHLYALNPDSGGTVWKSNLLDSRAVYSAVVVDRDGDIYVSDSEELFAFHSNGALKWRISISDNVYTTAITTDGYLIAITENGEVMAVNRDNGSLAANILYLDPPPEGRVINTPAIHPVTNRIYMVTGDAGVTGRFYGIDFEQGSLSIAFEMEMGQHSATSPTISYDGSHIYVADRENSLYAFNENGSLAWTYPLSGRCLGSPSIGPTGEIYFLDGDNITAIRDLGPSTEFLWNTQDEFAALAAQLPDYGYPRVARANSVVTIATNYVYFAVSCGYLFTYKRVEYFIPHRTLVCTVDPYTGTIIGQPVEVRDVCECAPTVTLDGDIYIPHGSVSSSIAYRLNKVLPPALRIPKPLGGITALQSLSSLALAENRIKAGKKKGQEALSFMGTGNIDDAITSIDREVEELEATHSAIKKSVEDGEIDSKTADQAQGDIDDALFLSSDAKKFLSAGNMKDADKSVKNADKKLEKVLKDLGKAK